MMLKMSVPSLATTLPNIEAFCRTYELGSFTAAAQALSVTPQATSRSVARLERALGVTLFRRTTRTLAATEDGQRYYELCVRALSLLAAGERSIVTGKTTLTGTVRVSAPTTYGHYQLIPRLGGFYERYPDIRVELHISNANIDFVRDGYDFAIRMGRQLDKTFVARKLGDFPLGVYASPSYLTRRGVPQTPEDLAGHTCIAFVMPSSGRVLPWTFHPEPQQFVPVASYSCSEDVLGSIGLAKAGIGLVQTYDFLVAEDISRGALVEVLSAYRGAARPFSLIYPQSMPLSPAAEALKSFILDTTR